MKGMSFFISVLIFLLALNQYLLVNKVNAIKQEIVEIKKDYSYDPRDAK